MSLFQKEPAVIIGIIAAAVLAAIQSLSGNGVISPDLAETVRKAIDPSGGWAIPIIVAIITRFAVYSPNTVATKFFRR